VKGITNLVSLAGEFLSKEVSVLLEWSLDEDSILPQVRGKVTISSSKSEEHSLDVVTSGSGVANSTGVAITDTSEGKNFLSNWRGNKSSTSWGRDKSDSNRTTFTGDLGRDSVWKIRHTSPVSSSDWHDVQFSGNDGTSDGSGDLTGAFNSKTDVSIVVTDSDEGLKSCSLTSRRLLLDRHDSHDFIGKSSPKEMINDLVFLDRDGEKKDFLDGSDTSILN
jgi:hypothetical protein